MSRKKQKRKTNRGLTLAQHKKRLEAIHEVATGLVNSVEIGIKRGLHLARAKTLAPLLAAMKNSADFYATSQTRDITLNRTDCALLLDVLAEAGYRPGQNFDDRREWRLVHMPKAGAPACEANGSDPNAKPMVFERTASEVAKAA